RAADHLGIARSAATPAADLGLIALGGRVTFRHPLVRSAIYRAASASEVRAVHTALAAATDAERDPERLAWHRALAADGPDEDVALEVELAAQRAAERGALITAGNLMTKAMELTSDPVRRGSRAVAAALMISFGSGDVEARLRAVAAAELCPLDAL